VFVSVLASECTFANLHMMQLGLSCKLTLTSWVEGSMKITIKNCERNKQGIMKEVIIKDWWE
jgi:hypothetical protein